MRKELKDRSLGEQGRTGFPPSPHLAGCRGRSLPGRRAARPSDLRLGSARYACDAPVHAPQAGVHAPQAGVCTLLRLESTVLRLESTLLRLESTVFSLQSTLLRLQPAAEAHACLTDVTRRPFQYCQRSEILFRKIQFSLNAGTRANTFCLCGHCVCLSKNTKIQLRNVRIASKLDVK